jgi:putative hydrolase
MPKSIAGIVKSAGSLPPGTPLPTLLAFASWPELNGRSAIDYHMHTTYTDGKATVSEMVQSAVGAGLSDVLFSEHVRHTSQYFPQFASEIRGIVDCPVTLRCGVETKLLDMDGTLDCSPDTAGLCDAIVGSVHSAPVNGNGTSPSWSTMNVKAAIRLEFEMAMAIVVSSRAHVLGHPMGMCVTRLKARPLDELSSLAEACRAAGKAFELNPRYCADVDAWVEIVATAGCLVSIGSDAHMTADVGRAWRVFVSRERKVP